MNSTFGVITRTTYTVHKPVLCALKADVLQLSLRWHLPLSHGKSNNASLDARLQNVIQSSRPVPCSKRPMYYVRCH